MTELLYTADTSTPRAMSSAINALSWAARAEVQPLFPTWRLKELIKEDVETAANFAAKKENKFSILTFVLKLIIFRIVLTTVACLLGWRDHPKMSALNAWHKDKAFL